MKLFIALLIPTLLFINSTWLTDLNEAKQQAAEKRELILLNFSGSDWCSPCIQLKKKLFQNEVFMEYASASLVLLNADFPRQKKHLLTIPQVAKNEKLAEIYNPEGKFPLTLLLDSSGKVLKSWEGFPDLTPAQFVAEIKTFSYASR